MTAAPRIIRVDHADKVLIDLQAEIFPADTPAPVSVGEWFLAVDDDGAAVAFAGMVPVKSWAGVWYLNRCGVLPAWRGQGLQRRLIHARVRRANRFMAPAVISATMPWNVRSTANLLACGFGPYWPDRPWLEGGCYWVRWLREGR
jgi:GNAT superfamily N-acetyltransferase